ncbi:ead/Ea22-like family protein [Salmonella enterica subsp. enterica]|nr:ead/Ea22-like family protein [Salmonella enterica]ECE0794466.1 ead/Ea22-like family protein [Salmonella enterica subsp. enterica serovar Onderstepoort]ECF7110110.1 ead/Ea22-like family protein [Salmonella enterica subsp. enterica serovar Onderstepoort]ECI0230930.1 ead/Ea22-like family protein [Salmonella enterica subsp. enterica serovar Bahrenfeld]EDR2487283.1 ead/Ea22-like family protein [Salmonella enterica subsp. enterica serovar Onderstepoort]
MSNIDKQAVKAKTKELASLMVERFSMNPVSCKLLNEAWKKEFPDEVAIAERMLALLDENIQLQRGKDAIEAVALALRDDMRDAREQLEEAEHRMAEQSAIVAAAEKLVRCKGRYHSELNYRALAKLFGVITPDLPPLEHENVHYADAAEVEITALRQRIAELERSETQLINERDCAESALADMYQAATGERPEWSNMFGFADAVDVVEERLSTLEANQSQTTPTGIQLITEAIGAHGYIVGCLLQGRPDLALEESRKWVSAFGQAAEIVSAQDADDIKVKGE